MRKFYLIGAIIITVLILILSFAQIQTMCMWALVSANTNTVFFLLQMSLLGAIVGGMLVLWWKTPKPGAPADGGDDDISA
jgi:hypothetical protein